MGIIKSFMGGGFPWDEVNIYKKCNEWINLKKEHQCSKTKYGGSS